MSAFFSIGIAFIHLLSVPDLKSTSLRTYLWSTDSFRGEYPSPSATSCPQDWTSSTLSTPPYSILKANSCFPLILSDYLSIGNYKYASLKSLTQTIKKNRIVLQKIRVHCLHPWTSRRRHLLSLKTKGQRLHHWVENHWLNSQLRQCVRCHDQILHSLYLLPGRYVHVILQQNWTTHLPQQIHLQTMAQHQTGNQVSRQNLKLNVSLIRWRKTQCSRISR